MENNRRQRFISAMIKKFEIDESAIVPDGVIRDTLDIDSLGLVDLLVLIEDIYGVRLQSNTISQIVTFGDMFNILDNHE